MFAASAPRLIASTPAGLLVTAALGALLYALVSQTPPPPPPTVDVYDLKFRALAPQPERPVETPRERPERTPLLVATGPSVTVVEPKAPADGFPSDAAWGGFRLPPLDPAGGSGFIAQGPQRLFNPIVDYPQAMYPREGSCEVRFDVTAVGATANVEVVSCTDRGFARAAERTVARVLYRPVQGEAGPVASPGHTLVIDFKIEE